METYDFILRGGRQIDFQTGEVREADLFVRGGKIVPGGPGAAAVEELDCRGSYVLPGLIDRHAHLHYGGAAIGAHPDLLCLPSGVTTAADGGTVGWANCELFFSSNDFRTVTSVKSFLNVSNHGVLDVGGWTENIQPEEINGEKLLEAITRWPHRIRGLKIRIDADTLTQTGLAPLHKAVEVADEANRLGYHCAVDTHVANLPHSVDIQEVAAVLRPGDIFTHVFQNRGQTIFDERGRVLPGIREARRRGVLFDCCNGRIHWSFENYRRALEDGFLPDIISSDIIRVSTYVRPGFSLLHAMGTLLAAGMDEVDILRAVTEAPARAMGLLGECGTLGEGADADVAVIDVANRPTRLFDRFGGACTAHRVFVPMLTMKRGELVFRQTFF